MVDYFFGNYFSNYKKHYTFFAEWHRYGVTMTACKYWTEIESEAARVTPFCGWTLEAEAYSFVIILRLGVGVPDSPAHI